jgi:hypothetical protein
MGSATEVIRLTPLGGPTVLLETGEVRLLADPTFDPAGEYPIGSRRLVKTAGAVWTAQQVGMVDAVLLSHDQHPDNLVTGSSGRHAVSRPGRPAALPGLVALPGCSPSPGRRLLGA